MYISRVRLRRDAAVGAVAPLLLPRNGADRRAAEHRVLWSVMTSGEDQQRDFLYRREREGHWIVLSRRPPVNGVELCHVESKLFSPRFYRGQRLAFMLRAHATTSQGHVRHDVVMNRLKDVIPRERAMIRDAVAEEEGRQWLVKQGAQHGFEPGIVRVSYRTERVTRANGKDLDLGVLDLAGELTVTNPQILAERLVTGFGRAKSFGYGLMMLRRP